MCDAAFAKTHDILDGFTNAGKFVSLDVSWSFV